MTGGGDPEPGVAIEPCADLLTSGCSGWVYKDWRCIVYPEKLPQRLWVEHYNSLFDTVEINNTFYRLPADGDRREVGGPGTPGFTYAVKLGGFGSHRMKLRDAASWLHDDVFALLEKHGAALCIHDLLPDHPWERTTDWAYVRFHGPNAIAEPYNGLYGARRLGRVADRLSTWLDHGCDVYAYFNND